MIGDQAGLALPLAIEHEPPTSYSAPVWSPDSRSIAFTDKRLNLWNVDVALGVKKEDGTDQYMVPAPTRDLSWSPDQNGCVRQASAQPVPRDHCPLRSRRSHTPTDRPPVQRSPARSDPSPLQPQRDVEPVAAPRAPSDSARGAAPTTVTPPTGRIHFDDIGQRILAVDVRPRNYVDSKTPAPAYGSTSRRWPTSRA